MLLGFADQAFFSQYWPSDDRRPIDRSISINNTLAHTGSLVRCPKFQTVPLMSALTNNLSRHRKNYPQTQEERTRGTSSLGLPTAQMDKCLENMLKLHQSNQSQVQILVAGNSIKMVR